MKKIKKKGQFTKNKFFSYKVGSKQNCSVLFSYFYESSLKVQYKSFTMRYHTSFLMQKSSNYKKNANFSPDFFTEFMATISKTIEKK